MANWLEFVDQSGPITHLYDVVPDLGRVWLGQLNLFDNPACSITLTTAEVPRLRPERWGQFNVVYIELGMTELRSVSISGWPWERFVEVAISRQSGGVFLAARGPDLSVEILCGAVYIVRVKGLMCEDEWLSEFHKN